MHVLYIRLDPSCEQQLADRPSGAAPPAYRDRLRRMRSRAARVRTVAGLCLLEQGLRRLNHDAAVLNRIGFSATGRPEIAGAPAFSIAHSRTLVACVVAARQAVGLDVEARRPLVSARLARLLGTDADAVAARSPERFFDDWCAREAVVKASGRVGLARIRQLTLHPGYAHLDARDWPLRALDLGSGYAACVASDRAIGRVTLEACVIPPGG